MCRRDQTSLVRRLTADIVMMSDNKGNGLQAQVIEECVQVVSLKDTGKCSAEGD